MSPKKKNPGLKKIQTLVSKNLNLRKFKVNPTNVIEDTKNKIGNFYTKLKLEREKEKKRQEKKRKNDEKRELLNQKRQAQKERLQKIREEKNQIIAQKKLVIDNEKQIRKNEEKRKKIEAKRIKIEQQKIKDEEAKKLREDARRLKEEELRLKILERQRIREEKIKAKEEVIKAKEIEAQKIREEREKERHERNRIQEIVNRLAMANPSVNFSLSENGRNIISLKAKTSDLFDARLSRLGDIMGQDFQNNSIPIDAEREGYRMTGYASLPTLNRRNSAMQFLFVNGRPVRDKLLLGAVRGAYREFLAQNRYPMIVLFLDANPNTIDVNVHPAKTEVRFKDDGIVRGLIVGGLRHALSEAGHRASTTVADAALGAARLSLGQSQLLVHTNPSINFKTPIAPNNHSFATHLPGLDAPLRGPEISSKNTLLNFTGMHLF